MMPIAVNPLYDGKRLLEIRDRFLVLAEEIKRGKMLSQLLKLYLWEKSQNSLGTCMKWQAIRLSLSQ